MPIRSNGYFNNPAFAQAAGNLQSLFEPPSGADAAGWATADAKRQEAMRLQDFFTQAPTLDRDTYDRTGAALGIFNPNAGFGARDMDDATKRYGYDTQASTSRANNADDNARALELSQLSELQKLYGALNEGQVRPELPEDVATRFGVDRAMPAERGLPKPRTAEEVRGGIIETLPPELQRAIGFGNTPVENIVTEEGPRVSTRLDAIGQEPVLAKGQTINVGGNNDIGTIPAGFAVDRDPEGNVTGMRPIPGGPADRDSAAAAAKLDAGKNQRNTAASIVVDDIDRALAQIDASPALTTGPGAAITSGLPGTPAFDTSALIDTVKANAGFDRLQQMRDASPTGGALGAVSEFENKLLQAAIGNLELAQSPEQVRYNLKRVSNIYRDIIDGPDEGGSERYDLSQPNAPLSGAPASGAPAAPAPAKTGPGQFQRGPDGKLIRVQ